MPKAFTEHEKNIIRERLVEQGFKQFAAFGLRKTNIEELAAAAGISKGAFYIFYESKEALFMDVAEEVEKVFRRDLLTAIDLPGPSPRARLFHVFKMAFDSLKTIPLLALFSGGDYNLLSRRVPTGKIQEHLGGDLAFMTELVARCQQAGIPIQVSPEEIIGLLFPLVLAKLHEDDFSQGVFPNNLDALLELAAACCLGEVAIQMQDGFVRISSSLKDNDNELNH